MSQNNESIFWDGHGLGAAQSGIGVYASNLSRNLVELGITPTIVSAQSEQCFRYLGLPFLAHNKTFMPEFLRKSKLFHATLSAEAVFTLSKKKNWEGKRVIFHGLANINVPTQKKTDFSSIGFVVTVHDLIPLIVPKYVSSAFALQFAWLIPRVLRMADRIVCVSQWTGNVVKERFPAESHKVVVIANGFTNDLKSEVLNLPIQKDVAVDPGEEGIRLLTVGRGEMYKRLELVVDLVHADKTFKAVIVTDQIGLLRLKEKILPQCINRIQIIPGLSREELSNIYRKSDVYIQPSLYEGFCLPVAEALNFGLPVVYTKGSAVDELVDPGLGLGLDATAKISEWVDACKEVAKLRTSQQFLTKIIELPQSRPSWQTAALAMKSLYTSLLNE